MTLGSEKVAKTHNGNGATTVWDYDFKIWDEDDLEVWITDANGAETLLNPSTYSVTGVGNEGGGNVTYPLVGDALASGNTITLLSNRANLQNDFDVSANQTFSATVVETTVDKVVRLIQQLQRGVNRAVKVGIDLTDSPDEFLSDIRTAVTDTQTAVTDAQTAVTAAETAQTAAEAAANTIAVYVNEFTATAAQDTFLLTFSINITDKNFQVFIDGVKQAKSTTTGIDNGDGTYSVQVGGALIGGEKVEVISTSAAAAVDLTSYLTLAQNWAEEDEDVEVETGKYSARHYSLKAATFDPLNFYLRTALDGGQLDNRYYTETELDGGQLDNRYYTETELDGGQLDNRYYTETELDGKLIGTNQTWQNVTASRAVGVTYTNNTGKPIYVSIRSATVSATENFYLTVDGLLISQAYEATTNTRAHTITSLIPDGSTYTLQATYGVALWAELR